MIHGTQPKLELTLGLAVLNRPRKADKLRRREAKAPFSIGIVTLVSFTHSPFRDLSTPFTRPGCKKIGCPLQAWKTSQLLPMYSKSLEVLMPDDLRTTNNIGNQKLHCNTRSITQVNIALLSYFAVRFVHDLGPDPPCAKHARLRAFWQERIGLVVSSNPALTAEKIPKQMNDCSSCVEHPSIVAKSVRCDGHRGSRIRNSKAWNPLPSTPRQRSCG